MVSDRIYELCRPLLENDELGEEEKTDRLEELLTAAPTSLKGKALEDAVLGALWQHRSLADTKMSPPVRGAAAAAIRSRSPAPWLRRSGTPGSGAVSPRPSSTAPVYPPGLGPIGRNKSFTASPFSSPRPSPRMLAAAPLLSQSPGQSSFNFRSDSPPTAENYGDYGTDNVDWLLNDDASSSTSFGDSGFQSASDFTSPYTAEMTPYDMLRSILQDSSKTDEELDQILEANGYDLSQAINSMMGGQDMSSLSAVNPASPEVPSQTILIGKSLSPSSRPVTPAGQQKSPIVCRYWLASGHCARADCRFAHEVQNHVCKYWLQGHCLAGNNCLFSHDPSSLVQQLSFSTAGGNPSQQITPNFQLQDYDSFPSRAPLNSNPFDETAGLDSNALNAALQHQGLSSGLSVALIPNFVPAGPRLGSSSGSRPASRHASRAPTPSQPNFQDDEAFPTLGSAAAKPGKRHHGKRGGHGHHTATPPQPSSLADVVCMLPAPSPNSKEAMRRGLKNNRSFTSTRENSSAAMAIPAPTDIPWLETEAGANSAYIKARQEAFKHGGLRNKFLQSAAQAWNRNDARGAKALSLRGQNENTLIREKHREAAQILYGERNKHQAEGERSRELYVDLHGLHPEEAVAYLSDCLKEQRNSSRPVYAICGTGHHSKNGKDKVGKAVRVFLNDLRYAFREFSVPGDRNNVSGILGIDPSSHSREAAKQAVGKGVDGDSGISFGENKHDTKVQVVKEDPTRVVSLAAVDDT